MTSPKFLIINSSYDPPSRHWFEAGDNRKAVVKIVDDRGIESLKVIPLKD